MIFKEFAKILENFPKNSAMTRDYIVHQSLWFAKDIWDLIPSPIMDLYNIQENFVIGIEQINPGDHLELHTDFPNRKSNLLINISTGPASIFHTHNGYTEQHTINVGEEFLLDTVKEHGCKNNSMYAYKFLTINTRKRYDESFEHFYGQVQ